MSDHEEYEDDGFTEEERSSKELREFEDVWKSGGNRQLRMLHDDVMDCIQRHGDDSGVSDILRIALEELGIGFLGDPDFVPDTECDEDAFPIWRKWHPRPS